MARRPRMDPYKSIASQMTPAHHKAVRDAADAELRGDAATALARHRSVPMFRRSTHGDRLQVLATLGDEAPGWLVSRWLTVQARRREWTGGDETAITRNLEFVMPMVYPHGRIPWEPLGCEYAEQVVPSINERDWVVRQADLYETGALRELVRKFASPELLARADRIEEWCRAPLRPLRFQRSDGQCAVFLDLSTKAPVELLDLGVGDHARAGECFLGRVVPTRDEPGALFDWPPLPVDEDAAQMLAKAPSRWLMVLHHLALTGRLEPGFSHRPEASLVSDLPLHGWMALADVPAEEREDRDPLDVVGDALDAALSMATNGEELGGLRHTLTDLVLDVSLTEAVRLRRGRPELETAWHRLASVVRDPAGGVCREMAWWCAAAQSGPASA